MRNKGSRFTLGVWGLRVCSLDVADRPPTIRNGNRPQPSSTVRNRLRESPMTVPMGSAAKVVTFGGFKCVPRFVWPGVALCNTATSFIVSKVVLCDRRNTFCKVSEDELHFSWQAQHLETSIVILHGRRKQHFRRMVLCVFCRSHFLRAASNGDTVQIPCQIWQAWHFLRCDEN